MDVPIVSFLENYTLEKLFELLTKYGVCTDFVIEGNNNVTNKNRIFVGSITAIYRPKIRPINKSPSIYTLNAVNLVTKNNEKGTPVRIVLLGNVVHKLIEARLKKEDIIAILNPKFFFVNYSDSKLATLAVGPLNVILWLCRNLKLNNSSVNSSPKKVRIVEQIDSESCQETSLSDDNVPGPDCPSISTGPQVNNSRVNSSTKKISNEEESDSASCQESSLSDVNEPRPDGPSISTGPRYNTRGKTPAKNVNRRERGSTCDLLIESDDVDVDPDYCPSVSSEPGYNTRRKTPVKNIQRRESSSTCGLDICSDDTGVDPNYCPAVSSKSGYNTRRKTPVKNIQRRESSSTCGLDICSDDTDADPNYCPADSSESEPVEESILEESITTEKSKCSSSVISGSIDRNNDSYRHVPAIIINDNSQKPAPPSNSSLIINKKTFSKNIPKPAANLNNFSQNTIAGSVKAVPNKSVARVMNEVNDNHDKEVDLNTNSSPCKKIHNPGLRKNNSPQNKTEELNSSPKRSLFCSQEKFSQNQSNIRQACSPSKFSHRCSHQSSCAPLSCCLHGPFHCRPEPLCSSCTPSYHFQHHTHCNSCNCNIHYRHHNCSQDKCFQRNCEPSPCFPVRPANDGIVDNRNNLSNDNASDKSCGRLGIVCPSMKSYVDNYCRFCQPKAPCCNFHKSPCLPDISCHNCHNYSGNFGFSCVRNSKQGILKRSNERCDPPIEVNGVERTRNWVMNCNPPSPAEQDVISMSDYDSSVNSVQIQEKVIPPCLTEETSRKSLNTFLEGNFQSVCKTKRKLFNIAQSPCLSVRNSVKFAEDNNSCSEKPTPGNSKGPSKIINDAKLSASQLSNQRTKPSPGKKSNECRHSNPGSSREQELPSNNEVFQESASEPENENPLSRTEELGRNPISDPLVDGISNSHNSINNDVPNKLKDDNLQKKRKKEVSSQLRDEALVSEAMLKKRKTTTVDPALDQESIKSIETIDLEEVISLHLETENNLGLSKSGSSQAALSPKSVVSSSGTFHDAHSTGSLSQRSRASPDDQWIMKPIKDINDYSNIATKFSQLDVIVPQQEPLTFKLYSSFPVKGIMINMIPSPDNLGSMIMGLCHARCKRTYEYNEFREMKKMDGFLCTNCKHRFHYACPICDKDGLSNPLCIFFSFDIHLFVNDCVLRVEVEYQDAIVFLEASKKALEEEIQRILMC